MISVSVDSRHATKILFNSANFADGFLDGITMEKLLFMQRLGQYVIQLMYKYIDAQARGNPAALHHVYEWGATGSPGGRLYNLDAAVSISTIHISGNFLPSSSVSDTATVPFVDKANIMENKIAITIEPNSSNVLVFEGDQGLVFTANSVYVANPGGDAVAGSFGRVVDQFFGQYFTNALLRPFLAELERAEEFTRYFPAGANGGGTGLGIKAGREYLRSAGSVVI